MKKITIPLLLTVTYVFAVYAVLDGDWFEGADHYCHYTDGRTIKVDGARNCPLSID